MLEKTLTKARSKKSGAVKDQKSPAKKKVPANSGPKG